MSFTNYKSAWKCESCAYGPCYFSSTNLYVTPVCRKPDGGLTPHWDQVNEKEEGPEHISVEAGDWIYDTAIQEFGVIKEEHPSHVKVKMLGQSKTWDKPRDYVDKYYSASILITFAEAEMHDLVGKPIHKEGEGTFCVLSCSVQDGITVVRTSKHQLDADDLVTGGWFVGDHPCGRLLRQLDNGEWY